MAYGFKYSYQILIIFKLINLTNRWNISRVDLEVMDTKR